MKEETKESIRHLSQIGIGAILLFNLVDIVLTLIYIKFGDVAEYNPIMRVVLDYGVFEFVMIKSALVCFGCYFLNKFRNLFIATLGIYFCFIAYFTTVLSFLLFICFE